MNKKHVIGFRHTGIITNDINQSLHFYKDILGLEVIQEFYDDSDYLNEITNLKDGTAHFIKLKMLDGTVLELLEYPTHKTEPFEMSIINVGLPHIALQVEDINYTHSHLVSSGVKVLSKPVLSSEGIAKVFFCLDPDNVRVEIVEMI
ncbi:VOC family protein [Acidimicrobiaceae bacterium]|nr:VOC family protein [Acidimicrobiaceae bacterium]